MLKTNKKSAKLLELNRLMRVSCSEDRTTDLLRQFLSYKYGVKLEKGAPLLRLFYVETYHSGSRIRDGLCQEAAYYRSMLFSDSTSRVLSHQLMDHFRSHDLSVTYPFGGLDRFHEDLRQDNMRGNSIRMSWLHFYSRNKLDTAPPKALLSKCQGLGSDTGL